MKKTLFGISILIGVLLSIMIPYFFRVDSLALYVSLISLSTATITAVYNILAEPDPDKQVKREIYGQLKTALLYIIPKLENKDYQSITLDSWDTIQRSEKHHFVDKDLRERLDKLLEKINQYNSAIVNLDNKLLPKIAKETAKEVFDAEPEHPTLNFSMFFLGLKRPTRPAESYAFNMLYHLKRKHSMDEIASYAKTSLGIENTEIVTAGMMISYLKAYEPFNLDRQKREKEQDFSHSKFETTNSELITKFWEWCLDKLESAPEHKLMLEENESILKEAREILPELIKRIEKLVE